MNKTGKMALIFLAMAGVLAANQHEKASLGIPHFQAVAPGYPTESPDTARLEVIIKIPYDAIQFLKKANTFEAQYELSVSVMDTKDNQIEERIQQRTVESKQYSQTISSKTSDLFKETFRLSPAKYKCTIELTDQDTRKSGRQTINVDLLRFGKKVVLGDLLLVDSRTRTEDFPSGLPIIPSRITDVDSVFSVYYEARVSPGAYTLRTQAISAKNEILSEETASKNTTVPIVAERLEHRRLEAPGNKFKLQLRVEKDGETSESELLVEIKWRGLSAHLSNLDQAIEQIRYIATRDELVKIQKARGKKKEEQFRKFWEKRDPSPNTPENELMDEYFRRVQYSNDKFGTFRDGWRTAMGMIFVLFGPPDDIEISHFSQSDGRSYQKWNYYVINRSFVFVDYNGFGDYELLEPYYSRYGSAPR